MPYPSKFNFLLNSLEVEFWRCKESLNGDGAISGNYQKPTTISTSLNWNSSKIEMLLDF